MSNDLQWLLVRKWNSFQHPGVLSGPILSREKGNLKNVHSQKYSGLSNSKVINIYADKEGAITITKMKKDANANSVVGARSHSTLRRSTGARKANKIAAVETAGKGYRADLRPAAVARISALTRANARSANPPKTYPTKVRGKKAAKGAAKATEEEDDDVVDLD